MGGKLMVNIKNIPSRVWINDYRIKFEYDTTRKNHRTQERNIRQNDEESAKRDFWIWIDTMKEKEPHRGMLNVNILSIEHVGGQIIHYK